ncbi:CheR family methyltransferase [Bacteroidota bacterium]
MAFEAIKEILKSKTGLDVDSIDEESFNLIINTAIKNAQCNSEKEYFRIIKYEQKELVNLIDKIIDTETWFLRDKKSFDYLKEYVNSEWEQEQKGEKLRVLSVPCSTGEEPYSIAVTLLESGMKPGEFVIDAVDISPAAIETARQALYSKASFRDAGLEFTEKYFQKAEDIYVLNPKIANLVNFSNDNLIHPDFFHSVKPYDIIFAKNIFTHLNHDAIKAALSNLYRILNDKGILFTSDNEISFFTDGNFELTENKIAFACRKRPQTDIEKPVFPSKKTIKDKLKNIPASLGFIKTDSNSVDLTQIQKLTDKGKFDEALEIGSQLISANSNNPDLYYMLGLIYEAKDNSGKAEEYYHKALYLEPYHYETIVHLTLIFEQKGWKERAELLRKRIDKITGMQ